MKGTTNAKTTATRPATKPTTVSRGRRKAGTAEHTRTGVAVRGAISPRSRTAPTDKRSTGSGTRNAQGRRTTAGNKAVPPSKAIPKSKSIVAKVPAPATAPATPPPISTALRQESAFSDLDVAAEASIIWYILPGLLLTIVTFCAAGWQVALVAVLSYIGGILVKAGAVR